LNDSAYAIQIYALRNFKDKIPLGELDSFLVYRTRDNFYKYIFGQFSSEDAASKDLDKAKNSGFKDAFVTRSYKLKPYKLFYKKFK